MKKNITLATLEKLMETQKDKDWVVVEAFDGDRLSNSPAVHLYLDDAKDTVAQWKKYRPNGTYRIRKCKICGYSVEALL